MSVAVVPCRGIPTMRGLGFPEPKPREAEDDHLLVVQDPAILIRVRLEAILVEVVFEVVLV